MKKTRAGCIPPRQFPARGRQFSFGPILLAVFLCGCPALSASDSECLECHNDDRLTMVKKGQEVSLKVEAAELSGSIHSALGCVDCHEGYDPTAIPHVATPVTVNCLACHEDLGPSHQFHPTLGELSGPDERPELHCVTCHGAHAISALAEMEAGGVSRFLPVCQQCHATETQAFAKSAHAGGTGHPYPDCLTCHRTDIVDGQAPSNEWKLAQSRLCLACHVDTPETASRTRLQGRFVASWGASVHGRALESGNAQAANCVDCHGSHEMARAMVADSRVNRLHIAETCHKCHPDEAEEYEHGSHGVALRKGEREAPVCTDCHGEHAIARADDPDAPVSPRHLSQELCGDCHGSVKLSQKYGIASDRFQTFADSFHGLAERGRAVEVVNCASCHGAHSVLRSNDPASPVHKDNLAATCGQCHPGANEAFTLGKVHVSLDPVSGPVKNLAEEESVVQIIATIYVWAIVGIVGGMFLHNALDFFKKVRRKVHGHLHGVSDAHVPHRLYLRMTVNERLQHGILALSFVVLVVTGFMLRYPEAWWVVWLREINDSVFAWRGLWHRIAAVVMVLAGVWHAVYVTTTRRGRELIRDLFPRWSDLADMGKMLRYNLGLARQKPLFGRFSYMEKAEYWALLWGGLLMTATGVFLWADEVTMGWIGKLGFDISRVIHYYEAILATLSIVIWHFYFVIFNPGVYPMNLSWLTGRLSEEEMADEHPLELARLQEEMSQHPEGEVARSVLEESREEKEGKGGENSDQTKA